PNGRSLLKSDHHSPYYKLIAKYFNHGGKEIPLDTACNYCVGKCEARIQGAQVPDGRKSYRIVPAYSSTSSIPEHDQAAPVGHPYPCFIPQLCPNGGGAARWEHRISPRLVAGPNRAVRTFRQIAIPRWEWSKRKLGIALLACPHAIAMGVSGILRGYPNALGWHQRKVPVYLAVYRAPR